MVSTHLKNISPNGNPPSPSRDENQKCLKPPSSPSFLEVISPIFSGLKKHTFSIWGFEVLVGGKNNPGDRKSPNWGMVSPSKWRVILTTYASWHVPPSWWMSVYQDKPQTVNVWSLYLEQMRKKTWLVPVRITPIYKPWSSEFGHLEGVPQLRGLMITMVINHLPVLG